MKTWMKRIAVVVAICFGLLQPCTALATYYAYDEYDIAWTGYEYIDYNGDGTAGELHYWYEDAFGNTADYYYYYDAATGYIYEMMSYSIWGQIGYWNEATSSYEDYYYETVYDYINEYSFEGEYYYNNSGSTFTELYFVSLAIYYYTYSYYAYDALTGAYEYAGYTDIVADYEDYYYYYWLSYNPGNGSYEYDVQYTDYYNDEGYDEHYWESLYTGAYTYSYHNYYGIDYNYTYYEYWEPESGWAGYNIYQDSPGGVTIVYYDSNLYSGVYDTWALVISDEYYYCLDQHYDLYEIYSSEEYEEYFGDHYGYENYYSSTPSSLEVRTEEWNDYYSDSYYYHADGSGYYYTEESYYEDMDVDGVNEYGYYYEERYDPAGDPVLGTYYYDYEFWDASLDYGYRVYYWTEPSGSYYYKEWYYTWWDGTEFDYFYDSMNYYDAESGWGGYYYETWIDGDLYGLDDYEYYYGYDYNYYTGAYSEWQELGYYGVYYEYSEVWYDVSEWGYYYEYEDSDEESWTELGYSYSDGFYVLESYYSYDYVELYIFLNTVSGTWNGYAFLYDWYDSVEYVYSIFNGTYYLIAYYDV